MKQNDSTELEAETWPLTAPQASESTGNRDHCTSWVTDPDY